MATRVTSTLIRVVPLLLLAYPSTPQTIATTTVPDDSPVCLNEILISAPNSYDASQVAAAQQKAEGALVAIRQGAKFEDVAKNYSDGPSAAYGGALGAFKRGQLAKKIEDKVFAMKVGDVSDVIRTKQGFTILQVRGAASPARCTAGRIQSRFSATRKVWISCRMSSDCETLSSRNGFTLFPNGKNRKKGELAIEFDITNEGKLKDMRLVATSGDRDLDRPAWDSITASNPFPPLPAEFTGPYLTLRFRFFYNPDKSDIK
jgi:TonB family protein